MDCEEKLKERRLATFSSAITAKHPVSALLYDQSLFGVTENIIKFYLLVMKFNLKELVKYY